MSFFGRLKWFFLCLSALLIHANPPKVFDCFPFCNEIELLKMRLGELNDVVDYFVLVESIETQKGTIKPLYFELNKHLFSEYLHKIIHVALRNTTPPRPPGDWWREHHQRRCIGLGLEGHCADDDIVMISDLDEIPRKAFFPRYKQGLADGYFAYGLHMPLYRHRLNWTDKNDNPAWKDWVGTVVTTYKNFKKYDAQYFREHRGEPSWPQVPNGGWHFSSMGNNDAIRAKMANVIEGTNIPTDVELQTAFQAYKAIPVDDSYPEYVLKNYDYLVSVGLIDPSTPPTFQR